MKGPLFAMERLYRVYPAKPVIPIKNAVAVYYLHFGPAALFNEKLPCKLILVNPKEVGYSLLFFGAYRDSGSAMAAMAAALAFKQCFFFHGRSG